MKKAIFYLKMTPAILYTVTLRLVGYLLYVLSGLVRSLAFLLMLSPESAKNQLRDMFRIY
ncbi:MAG: hypothetical protein RRY33_08910 [Alistipes sp.]